MYIDMHACTLVMGLGHVQVVAAKCFFLNTDNLIELLKSGYQITAVLQCSANSHLSDRSGGMLGAQCLFMSAGSLLEMFTGIVELPLAKKNRSNVDLHTGSF